MPEELVEALKRREPAAFERLIAQHGTMLYRVALRVVGQPQDAEEVVQEALLNVYEKIDTFDQRAALPSWLYRIVVNTALMRLRAKSRRPGELMDTSGPPFTADGQHAREVGAWALPPEDTLLRQEALVHLEQAIARLIADSLGCPIGTVMSRLYRARQSLRQRLERHLHGEDDAGPQPSRGEGAPVTPIDLLRLRGKKQAKSEEG
jgi:RNA polymerase sigma-70 factor (ECF subfamily)